MSLETVEIRGVQFDVYYDCTVERDPYGTGDSPTEYQIDIISIEAGADTQDLQDVLGNNIVDEIIEELIKVEAA